MLDSLRFVDLGTLRNELIRHLEALAGGGGIKGPALLLPERSLAELGGERRLNRRTAVAYKEFHPGAKLSPTPGSEGFIGSLLRDFARVGRNQGDEYWIAPDADLERLRDLRCRSIFVVTDYCGTGMQATTLAETLARHTTIRSWRSLKLIRIHVVCFAASLDALHVFENSSAVDDVHTIEAAHTFDSAKWTDEVREAIIELCLRESRSKSWALGYKRSAGLFATERGAPNNLPAIFWQQGPGWSPLFPGRRVMPEVATDLAGYQPSEPLPALAARVGQLRVGRNERLHYMRPTSRELLRVLLSLNRSRKSAAELAADLDLPLENLARLTEILVRFEWIDSDLRITAAGRQEILAQRHALRRTVADLHGSDVPYYPYSLR